MYPTTRYARTRDGDVAYQILSDGPVDLLFALENYNNIEVMWEEPLIARFFERLAAFSRLIVFNFRGGGVSDGLSGVMQPTAELMADDLRSVLDAAASSQAFVVGNGVAGSVTGMFAAMDPRRVSGLILLDSAARWGRSGDYLLGAPAELLERMAQTVREQWGMGMGLARTAPSLNNNARFKEWYSRYERLSCGPAEAEALVRVAAELDMRSVLQIIQVPTLILCHTGDRVVRPENSRYLAEQIVGARLVELAGVDHLFYAGDVDPVIREIHEFVTGAPVPEPTDRVLSTVLFTDIVSSTERAAELGDQRWRDILDSHDALGRRQVATFGGRLIKTTGDGVLATFDGPARAIKCARKLGDDAKRLEINLRAGLHTGEIELRGEDIGGIAVHLAARVLGEAGPSEVLVSSTVKDLVVGSGIEFDDRGTHTLKGVPGEWRLYAVRSPD